MDTSVLFTSIHNSWIVSAGNLQKLCLLTRYSINAINDYAYKHTGPRDLHQGRQPKILTGIPFILSFSFRYVSQAVSERAKSPGVCLSRNLCSLVLYESFVLSEWKRKITHLYSLQYSLGFIPIATVTGAATKRNTNVSKELSVLLLRMQRTDQMTLKKEAGSTISNSKFR